MSMQDSDGPGYSLELFVILTESPYGLPDALDHRCIQRALMMPCHRSEFFRQGKGQQKILDGQLFLELTFQPLLALMVLAVWAIAMAAGMRREDLAVALGALRQHLGTG